VRDCHGFLWHGGATRRKPKTPTDLVDGRRIAVDLCIPCQRQINARRGRASPEFDLDQIL
jgi:hypothetical protein